MTIWIIPLEKWLKATNESFEWEKISALHLFLYLINVWTAREMNCMCACICTLPAANQSQILPMLSFLFFLFPGFLSFPSHSSFFFFFRLSSILAICWYSLAAVWHERNQWHTPTLHVLLELPKDLDRGKVECVAGGFDRVLPGSVQGGQKAGEKESACKNKVVLSFIHSVLHFSF